MRLLPVGAALLHQAAGAKASIMWSTADTMSIRQNLWHRVVSCAIQVEAGGATFQCCQACWPNAYLYSQEAQVISAARQAVHVPRLLSQCLMTPDRDRVYSVQDDQASARKLSARHLRWDMLTDDTWAQIVGRLETRDKMVRHCMHVSR